jgi:hypothetical protein
MENKVVPMIHVPDVRATVGWYQNIGFTVLNTYGDDRDGLSFAILSFGSSEVMFSQGGRPSTQHRREVDLYVYTDDIDDLHRRLGDQVEVVESPHDTFTECENSSSAISIASGLLSDKKASSRG